MLTNKPASPVLEFSINEQGNKHGKSIIYSHDGAIAWIGNYENGIRVKDWFHYEEGYLSEKLSFSNDSTYTQIYYRKNGQESAKGLVQAGKKIGEWITFGKYHQKGNYINGKKDGNWLTVDSLRREKEISMYKEGDLVEVFKYRDFNLLVSQRENKNGFEKTIWNRYWKNKNLKEKNIWVWKIIPDYKGARTYDVNRTRYYKNGNRKKILIYKGGQFISKTKFDRKGDIKL